MRAQDIRDHLDRRPFLPFRIDMDDDSVFEIRHPEQVLLTPHTAMVGLQQIDGHRVYERTVFCALLHITRIEPEKQKLEEA